MTVAPPDAIAATVAGVEVGVRGTATIYLASSEPRCPKQLLLRNAPAWFAQAVAGTNVAIDGDAVYVGGKPWAKRIDRTYILLLARPARESHARAA